jgi:hypothetical protein
VTDVAAENTRAAKSRDPSKGTKLAVANLAGDELRQYSATLFVSNLEEGLTPSESADVLIQDARYLELREDYIGWCQRVDMGENPADPRRYFPQDLLCMDANLTRVLTRARRLEACVERTIERLPPEAEMIRSSISDEERAANPLWFTSDPILPDCVVRGMLASHREYAMAATVDGLVHRKGWSVRHFLAAGTVWAEETRLYLALLASVPDSNVPTSLIPVSERFELQREVAAQRSLIAQLCDTAS